MDCCINFIGSLGVVMILIFEVREKFNCIKNDWFV